MDPKFRKMARDFNFDDYSSKGSSMKPMKKIHLKWVDDMTVAECVNLKDSLVEITTNIQCTRSKEPNSGATSCGLNLNFYIIPT